MIDQGTADALLGARHGDPFAVLGPHDGVITALLPDATAVTIVTKAGETPMDRIDPRGVWAGPGAAPYRLRAEYPAGTHEAADAYAYPSTLGPLDLHLLAEGRHHELAHVLGAHPMTIEGTAGTRFAVWAPNARRVSVVGGFNAWDARRHPMRKHWDAGIWEIFVPGVGPGEIYKYDLLGPQGQALPQKADPVAWAAERAPATGSVVAGHAHAWTDGAWMQRRDQGPHAPMSIYEVHAASWAPGSEHGASWDALADHLVPYCAALGFTHLELLPVMEHPFGGSWGYQPLGQFAPSAVLGSPEGFARFVDRCHAMNIGVLLDWVPAHFPTDAHGLALFDGTHLYEHADPREGFHPDWNTNIFNLGRNEVRGFLIGAALFWLEHYHIDGLRVDAVASMLYRDYSRKPGEWVPNHLGGRENFESVAFLRDLSWAVRARSPGAVLIAEESTAWPGVTQPAENGGLGFDYKWNMGWMHDTLQYMEEDPINRGWHAHDMTFGMVYAYSERFVLPLSHDEVVYGKHSLLGKMPGDAWQRFANLRAYLAFMWSYPGKKLLFMGGEFGQEREWDHDHGLDWNLLDNPMHRGVQTLVRDLNHNYRSHPALHALDHEPGGFQWLVADDQANSVFAYLRTGANETILVVVNFTPVPRYDYRIGVPGSGWWAEILNSDGSMFGGSGMGNLGGVQAVDAPLHGQPASVSLTLPPLATLFLRRG